MDATKVWPDQDTLIPDLLEAAPQARAVLDRYGLHGCGGRLGPVESLGYFARAHEVPLEPMLEELRDSLRNRPATPTLTILDQQPPELADNIYRPFFKAGIAVVLTLGAVWGAWLLLRIAFAGEFSAAGIQDVNAHGHAQIFGWVGLFVMGFACQAFPRFKQTTLAWPRLAFASLWMMLIGLVVRSIAQPATAGLEWMWWPAVGASVLEVLAIGFFVAVILRTWQQSSRPLAFYDGYILSALFWFVVQGIYESVYLAATLGVEGPRLLSLVTTWQPALRDVQIHGFALLMILGVSQRIFHHFYGLREPNAKLSLALLLVLNLAVVGEVAGLILKRLTQNHLWSGVTYGSVLVLAGAVVVLVANWRIYAPTPEADRSLKFLRTAYGWLFLSLGMLVALPIYQHGLVEVLAPQSFSARIGFSHAYYGAIRHAITVGFVSLMIVGVAAKVVPTLNGISAARLSSLWAPFVLINLGCSLRVFGQIATDFTTLAFPVAGASGLLEVTGLALWGTHLWLIMAGRPRLKAVTGDTQPVRPAKITGPIEPQHTVGAVLEQHPELWETFLSHGFTTLASPQFRRTIANVVTLEKACRRMGVNLSEFLAVLNSRREKPMCDCCAERACDHQHPPATTTLVSLETERG